MPPNAAAQQDAAGSPAELAVDAAVEALLFSSDKPASPKVIADVLAASGLLPASSDDRDPASVARELVDASIDRLNEAYDRAGRAFRVEPVAGGLRVMTRPEHAPVLAAYHRHNAQAKLSRPAIETLAVIAYRQPITRARLEAVRGVGCGEVLKTLLERRLIAITGRAEELGRPMLYGTTKRFLDAFGLASLKDLPGVEGLPQPQPAPAPSRTDQA